MTDTPGLPEGPELERLLERSEVRLYDAFYDAVPADLARLAGIEVERAGDRRRFTLRAFDHPLWNRTMGLGLDGLGLDEAWLDATLAHYAAAGIRRHMQVLPHVATPGLENACGTPPPQGARGRWWRPTKTCRSAPTPAPATLCAPVCRGATCDPTGGRRSRSRS